MSAIPSVLLLLILMLLGGCAREEARPESSTAIPAPARIVFFGDSITEAGVQPTGYVTLVADSLKRRYPDRALEVIGAGISGNNVPDLQDAEISRAVANTSGAHLCDLRAAFEQHLQTHNPDKAYEGILTSDGVHLNEAGNRFVARFMVDHLNPLLAP